ncbi:SGNH/GDSL hydrolase family protein [Granulicella sibirica]|uniref:Putative secreted protein n=1 Tax=Granulicella sibirica TaxID=2479048 RepID=A0A4Q0T5H2_9BACT|nr:SGNH/GDSL hydrolase family protein [Granulicella sibirica]RXH58973.1 putative secreted protein [Granulicella sibirica]
MRHLLPSFAWLLVSAASVCHGQSGGSSGWTGTWSAAPRIEFTTDGIGTAPETIREIVHVSTGGRAVRIRLSNVFGTDTLRIDGVSIAVAAQAGTLKSTPELLTFNGMPQANIAAGKSLTSDSVSLALAPLSDLAVSILVPPETIHVMTVHPKANTTNYTAPGNQLLSLRMREQSSSDAYPFLVAVDVQSEAESYSDAGAIVCLGDSITQGVHSTPNRNEAWPDVLARTLQSRTDMKRIGVLNEGIGGNRIFQNGGGPAALSRFDRDVLHQSNVKFLVLAVGINDIGLGYGPAAQPSATRPTARQIEAAYRDLSQRAHLQGIKVIGATLTPFGRAAYFSEAGEAVRQEVNQWIRTSALNEHIYDSIVDFDQLLDARQNDSRPMLKSRYDSGDGLHPNDSGYELMGREVYNAFMRVDNRP